VARGLLEPGVVEVEVLGGGVSNDVVLVRSATSELVVKQALPRLRVAQVWEASRSRIVTEGEALRLARSIVPDGVPAVIEVVPADFLLVLESAPSRFSAWKDLLLAGSLDLDVASRVGNLLGTWHAATLHDAEVQARFSSLDAFLQLRIDPYYRTAASRHADLAERIEAHALSLLDTRWCLVHGDLSPKNVLTGHGGTWVIDWEVAHFGDPTFDLAFILCHLRCKAEHLPAYGEGFRQCAAVLMDAYEKVAPSVLDGIDEKRLVAHTACLILARVDGKSPVEYLDEHGRSSCRRLARDLIARDHVRLDEIWRS